MSVSQLTAHDLGVFAALPAHLELVPLDAACKVAFLASQANVVAYHNRYGEDIEAVSLEEIVAVAQKLVGDEELLVAEHGVNVYGNITCPNESFRLAIEGVEHSCNKWLEDKHREIEYAEQNAVAFNVVGQQATMTGQEIADECLSLGYSRVITASFNVDQSDSQSDYWGGRHTRTVVIGYGKGKRESFKQLREAAAGFKPTECFGPGKGVFTARVVYAGQYETGNGRSVYEGSYSPWHEEIGNGTEFNTKAKAEAFIAKAGEPGVVVDGGTECHFQWEIGEKEIEHRENYSMGGGNYLGFDRYSGWKVSSYTVGHNNSDKPVEVAPFKRVLVKTAKATKKAKSVAEVVIVNHESNDNGSHFVTMKVGSREIAVSHGKSGGVSVYTSGRSYGKHFTGWDRAKANYRTANIKAAIEAAESAVATRLDESDDSIVVDEPKAVSVDPAAFDEFAWL